MYLCVCCILLHRTLKSLRNIYLYFYKKWFIFSLETPQHTGHNFVLCQRDTCPSPRRMKLTVSFNLGYNWFGVNGLLLAVCDLSSLPFSLSPLLFPFWRIWRISFPLSASIIIEQYSYNYKMTLSSSSLALLYIYRYGAQWLHEISDIYSHRNHISYFSKKGSNPSSPTSSYYVVPGVCMRGSWFQTVFLHLLIIFYLIRYKLWSSYIYIYIYWYVMNPFLNSAFMFEAEFFGLQEYVI